MSVLHQFRGDQGGFGLKSYQRARAAGLNPKQIAAAIGSSGMSLGWRARDAIISDTASQAEGLKQQRNQAQADVSALRAEYQGQIDDYKSRIDDFRGQVDSLTNQYQGALKQSQEYQQSAAEFEDKFNKRTTEFEAARQEADRYREEAVGMQLRAIRSGATAEGSQTSGGGIGDLTGGRPQYSSGDDDALTKASKAEGGLTDSVLNRKGPVVERMVTSQQRSQSQQGSSGLSRGVGTGSYYASRFG